LSKITLEELNNRRWEVKLVSTFEHLLFGEGI